MRLVQEGSVNHILASRAPRYIGNNLNNLPCVRIRLHKKWRKKIMHNFPLHQCSLEVVVFLWKGTNTSPIFILTLIQNNFSSITIVQAHGSHNCSSTRKLKSRMIDFCLSFCLLFAYYHFLQHRSVCSNHPLLKPLPLQAFQTLVSSNGHILFLWVWIDLYQQ